MQVRPGTPEDREALRAFLRPRHSERVARREELVDPLAHPSLIAGEFAGVLTYIVDGDACEILTLHAEPRHTGAGTALIAAVERIATDAGCRRLWLITTNDNVDALRFHQRRGFRLATLHAGAVEASRAHLKPEIPVTGDYGIPLRDELELERTL